ncbi:hypothetical protein Mapa_011462 [Marchantia paleacea]|nr:hypothetical protein Mapa_011462 [Marchantia paleacea]
MDSGPNAYTLLGFATVDVNHPTLTPIRNERAVLMLQKSDSAWNDVLVREPWRDCNKLYSSIRGIVLGESQCMNLEDFGITEKEIVKPKVESACTEDLSSFQHFLGGAWVGTPSMLISVLSFNVASELATEFQGKV